MYVHAPGAAKLSCEQELLACHMKRKAVGSRISFLLMADHRLLPWVIRRSEIGCCCCIATTLPASQEEGERHSHQEACQRQKWCPCCNVNISNTLQGLSLHELAANSSCSTAKHASAVQRGMAIMPVQQGAECGAVPVSLLLLIGSSVMSIEVPETTRGNSEVSPKTNLAITADRQACQVSV